MASGVIKILEEEPNFPLLVRRPAPIYYSLPRGEPVGVADFSF